MLVTGEDDGLDVALGTMGGDAQPQILLQLLARLLVSEQPAGDAIEAARWSLTRTDASPFHVWHDDARRRCCSSTVRHEGWLAGLRRRGYDVLAEHRRRPLVRSRADDPRDRRRPVVGGV